MRLDRGRLRLSASNVANFGACDHVTRLDLLHAQDQICQGTTPQVKRSGCRARQHEEFEDDYTHKFRGLVLGRGLLVKTERDRAALDTGIMLTHRGTLELSGTKVWFQLCDHGGRASMRSVRCGGDGCAGGCRCLGASGRLRGWCRCPLVSAAESRRMASAASCFRRSATCGDGRSPVSASWTLARGIQRTSRSSPRQGGQCGPRAGVEVPRDGQVAWACTRTQKARARSGKR
jgi:hypothetical protein